jgi:hypothetical protein
MPVKQSQETPLQSHNFSRPQETRDFPPKDKVELITLGGITFGRATFEPGALVHACKPKSPTPTDARHLI